MMFLWTNLSFDWQPKKAYEYLIPFNAKNTSGWKPIHYYSYRDNTTGNFGKNDEYTFLPTQKNIEKKHEPSDENFTT